MALSPTTYIDDSAGAPQLAYSVVTVAPDGLVRHGTAITRPYQGERLFQTVVMACLAPEEGSDEGLPEEILVDEERVAGALRPHFAACSVPVRLGDTDHARYVLRELRSVVAPDSLEPLLANAPAAEAQAFMATAERFFDAEPWRAFEHDLYVAFRVGEGTWRYANVMGHDGEEFGLGLYDDWRSLKRFMKLAGNSVPGVDPIARSGVPVENLGLSPLWLLTPDDAAYYLDHDAPSYDGLYPILIRVVPTGLQRPTLPLSTYTGLMRLLTREAEGAAGPVSSVDTELQTPEGLLQVRYPATGRE